MGILKKIMRVIQGYKTVTRFLSHAKNTENRLKFIKMGIALHMYITFGKKWKEFYYRFSCKNAKKLSNNKVIYIKQPWSNNHIFGALPLQFRSPKCKIQKNWCTVTVSPTIEHHGAHSRNKPPIQQTVYYVDIRDWYKWCLVSGGMEISHKTIPFFVDNIVKNGHIDPKS